MTALGAGFTQVRQTKEESLEEAAASTPADRGGFGHPLLAASNSCDVGCPDSAWVSASPEGRVYTNRKNGERVQVCS